MDSLIETPLGWIPFRDRTEEQNEAHRAALAKMPKFAIEDYGVGRAAHWHARAVDQDLVA